MSCYLDLIVAFLVVQAK